MGSHRTPTAPDIPTSFTVGDRTYDLASFVKKGELPVSGDTMVARAMELGAELGDEHGRFILEHRNEIPTALRDKITMVFPKWLRPNDPRSVAYLYWNGSRWCQGWRWLGERWGDYGRLVFCRTV